MKADDEGLGLQGAWPHGLHFNILYKEPRSHEILMFVCLKKDAEQCCNATKVNCIHFT